LRGLGVRILLEPGRFLVGNAGVLLTRVRYIKQTGQKKFAIVDAGMNDLIRPALYQSYHEIVPARAPENAARETIDVVGPVCESGDFFAQDRAMPPLAEGNLVAIMSAGAYGFVMASNYNSRPLPAEVLVRGAAFSLIRERQSLADLVRGECDRAELLVDGVAQILRRVRRPQPAPGHQVGARRDRTGRPGQLGRRRVGCRRRRGDCSSNCRGASSERQHYAAR
jgi:hypothetical protein